VVFVACGVAYSQVPAGVSLSKDNSLSFDVEGFGNVMVRPWVVNLVNDKWMPARMAQPASPDFGQIVFSETEYPLLNGGVLKYFLRAEIDSQVIRVKSSWSGADSEAGFCYLYLAFPTELVSDISVFADGECVFANMTTISSRTLAPKSVSVRQTSTERELFTIESPSAFNLSAQMPSDPKHFQLRFNVFPVTESRFSDAATQELIIRFNE